MEADIRKFAFIVESMRATARGLHDPKRHADVIYDPVEMAEERTELNALNGIVGAYSR